MLYACVRNLYKEGLVKNMYYIIYLVGAAALFAFSVIFSGIYMAPENLFYYLDYRLLALFFLVCILCLFCTRLLKPFAHSFLFMFGKKELSHIECEQSLLSIKAVTSVSIFFGILLNAIYIIDLLHGLEDPSAIGPALGMALLALVYAALIYIILLPVKIALKKQLSTE